MSIVRNDAAHVSAGAAHASAGYTCTCNYFLTVYNPDLPTYSQGRTALDRLQMYNYSVYNQPRIVPLGSERLRTPV